MELEEIRNSIGIGAYGDNLFLEEYNKILEVNYSSSVPGKWQGQQSHFSESQMKVTPDMVVNALHEITSIPLNELQSSFVYSSCGN